MVFGIKYSTNRKGLKCVNKSLDRYGSAIMFRDKYIDIFFTNPIVALKVSNILGKAHKSLTYKVHKLTKEEEKGIDKFAIVSSLDEYYTLINQQEEDLIKKIEDLKEKYHLEEEKQL